MKLTSAWAIGLMVVATGGVAGAEVKVGDRAPGFTLPSVGGKQLELKALKGKVVVLTFWASWAPPSLKVFPELQGIAAAYPGGALAVVTISVDKEGRRAEAKAKALNVTLPVGLDLLNATMERYGSDAIPTTYLIDRTGVVRRVFPNNTAVLSGELRKAVDELLAAP